MINAKTPVSKKWFDTEYSTQTRKEYEFLLTKGFKPSFIKRDKVSGVKTYKYSKCEYLFAALTEFYSTIKAGVADA